MKVLTIHALKIAILRALAQSGRPLNKHNLIGGRYPNQRGPLEHSLNITFDKAQRALAAQAFEELKAAGLTRADYNQIVEPENWVEITEAGQQALRTDIFDELDAALRNITPHLLEIRRGAWAALAASQPDSLRQAAHSARELIEQVLKEGAPNAVIEAQPGFKPDKTSKDGVTRRMRLKFLMEKYHGSAPEADLKVVEKASDLVLAVDSKLQALSHARSAPIVDEVRTALTVAESALRSILLPRA